MSGQHQDKWVKFEDFVFHLPDPDLAYTLRYGEPSKQDLFRAASILGCYTSLILNKTQKDRNMISKRLKQEFLYKDSKVLLTQGCSG